MGLSVSKSLSLEFPHVVSKTLKMKLNFQFELIVKWYVQRNKQTWCWEALKACLCRTLLQARGRESLHDNQTPDTKFVFHRFLSWPVHLV